MTIDDDRELLADLDERGENLTPWEIDFVESLTVQTRKGIPLSPAQREKLRAIAEERIPE